MAGGLPLWGGMLRAGVPRGRACRVSRCWQCQAGTSAGGAGRLPVPLPVGLVSVGSWCGAGGVVRLLVVLGGAPPEQVH